MDAAGTKHDSFVYKTVEVFSNTDVRKNVCYMDVAGTKRTRFGLLHKLLHQNEIVPFFMDEKRNVAYVY